MYDHYIAVDWAQRNMAIARLTSKTDRAVVIDVPSSVAELRDYLKQLSGTKILTFEEMHTAQWLYTELRPYVDELIVCDPYRNRLLVEGPKTDKIDAIKLCKLLKAGLLKPVFHSGDEFIRLRKLVRAYANVIKAGVRLKNQRTALLLAEGKDKEKGKATTSVEKFIMQGLDAGITNYESERERFVERFKKMIGKDKTLKNLSTIPGIGPINAVKIAAIVVDPRRFPSKGHFLSYCGLIKLEKMSGGRSYGRKRSRYCRELKSVYKTAAQGAIREDKSNLIKQYFDYLVTEKRYAEDNAKNAAARRIAILSLAVWKRGEKFNPHPRRLEQGKKAA